MKKLKTGKNTFTLSRTVASLIEGINLRLGWEGKGLAGNGQKSAAVPFSDVLVLFHHSCGKMICKGVVKKEDLTSTGSCLDFVEGTFLLLFLQY